MLRVADTGTNVLSGELQQLSIFRHRQHPRELSGDEQSGAAPFDLGGAVHPPDQGGDGFGTELFEIAHRQPCLLARHLADVGIDEPVDEGIEPVLFFLRQLG